MFLYPPVIKHGNGKPTIWFHGCLKKISAFPSQPRLVTPQIMSTNMSINVPLIFHQCSHSTLTTVYHHSWIFPVLLYPILSYIIPWIYHGFSYIFHDFPMFSSDFPHPAVALGVLLACPAATNSCATSLGKCMANGAATVLLGMPGGHEK